MNYIYYANIYYPLYILYVLFCYITSIVVSILSIYYYCIIQSIIMIIIIIHLIIDAQVGLLLRPAAIAYESDRTSGGCCCGSSNDDFQLAVKREVLPGECFKAYPTCNGYNTTRIPFVIDILLPILPHIIYVIDVLLPTILHK